MMNITTYDDPVKNTLEAFDEEGFTFGSEIPTKWFMDHFRIRPAVTAEEQNRNSTLYARYMGSVRTHLLRDKNIALATIPGFGQKVVLPSEQTQWAMRTFQDEAVRAYEKAQERVSNIAFAELSDSERKENSDAVAKLSFFANRTVKKIGW